MVGSPYAFTASASNCTPKANAWTWNHSGRATTSTTKSISITWTTAGNKSIMVTNSGCPGVFDSHTVTVRSAGGQPADVACDPNATTLCTIGGRFRVRVAWETRTGQTGNGSVIPARTDNTGVFWFFTQDNWELMIKVLNGCGFNNHYWVFGAGATDVRYVVTVEDLLSGAIWEYENPQGRASPSITDTSAFETCP